MFLGLMAMIMQSGIAQEKDSEIKKIYKKVSVTIKSDGGKIQLKLIENGKIVVDKTYNSKEEMKNDPELEEYNIFMGEQGVGHINVTVDEGGNKKLMFIGEDGEKHELDADDHKIWIHKMEEGMESDSEFFFHSGDGSNVKIMKDEKGNISIERDGEMVDITQLDASENVKVEKLEDGTLVITDENGTRDIEMGEMHEGVVSFSQDGKFESKDGNVIHLRSKEDGSGNVTIELVGDGTWISDSLHDGDHNVIFFNESEAHEFGEDGEGQKVLIRKEINKDGEGTSSMVIIKVEKIHLEIIDLDNLREIEEIPGSNVVSNKILELDEVNYYPNPNTGVFNLQFAGKKKPTTVRVIDMMGKEVYTEKLDNFSGRYDQSIDLTGKNRGVYILQIIQGPRTWNKKIVIE